jgi:hypothetical protein
MDIIIEQTANSEDVGAMRKVWRQVFEGEMGIVVPQDAASSDISHFIARLGRGGEAVGTLSLVDTSHDFRLHESHDLQFKAGARSARFMHLAVLPPFRGMNIPLMMALEAHRNIIAPRRYDYTWLLFDVLRARSSFLCRRLGFKPRDGVYVSEYGRRCPLIRDELTQGAARAIEQAELYVRQFKRQHEFEYARQGGAFVSLWS